MRVWGFAGTVLWRRVFCAHGAGCCCWGKQVCGDSDVRAGSPLRDRFRQNAACGQNGALRHIATRKGSAMQRRVSWACVVCLVQLFSFANLALAKPADDAAARHHFESGRAYFERAEYDDAVREYEKSYALSLRPKLLVNISRAHESAGRPKEAADALERWLTVSPADDPMRTDMERRHVRLRAQAAKLTNTNAPTENPSNEAAEPALASGAATPERAALAPWLLIGGGGAALASGLVVGLLGRSDISDVEDAKQDTRFSSVQDQVDAGPRKVMIGSVLAGVGTIAAAAGVVWLLLGDDDAGESNTQVGLSSDGVQVWGRF